MLHLIRITTHIWLTVNHSYLIAVFCIFRNLQADDGKPPISANQVEITDVTSKQPITSEEDSDQPAQQPIKVLRSDNHSESTNQKLNSTVRDQEKEPSEDISVSSTIIEGNTPNVHKLTPLNDTHIGGNSHRLPSKASHVKTHLHERPSKSNNPALIDTHIGKTKVKLPTSASNQQRVRETQISTIHSSSSKPMLVTQGHRYDGGLLWPDVIDPYNRAQELELRIGDRAVDVFQCRSLTTITQFHK